MSMYKIMQEGKLHASFADFLPALLYACLESKAPSIIVGPEGRWSVKPVRKQDPNTN